MSFKMKLEKHGITSSDLDTLVDEAAQREASRINNEGLSEQLEYLAKQGMSESQILEGLGIDQ